MQFCTINLSALFCYYCKEAKNNFKNSQISEIAFLIMKMHSIKVKKSLVVKKIVLNGFLIIRKRIRPGFTATQPPTVRKKVKSDKAGILLDFFLKSAILKYENYKL